jgi:hypothetical protein
VKDAVLSSTVASVSATPILDLVEQAPPKPGFFWVPVLIGVVIGLALPSISIFGRWNMSPSWRWPGFSALLALPALYVGIAVHEIGHLITGRLAGLDVGGISIGAFVFVKSGDKWIFRFDHRRWLGGFLMPLTLGRDSRVSQHVWSVAGGPFASFALAALSDRIWTRFGDGAWDWTGTLLWASVFLAAVSVMPCSAGVEKSDCARMWQLIRRPKEARFSMTLVAIQTEIAKGTRPRDWSRETFGEVLAIDDSAAEYVWGQLLVYYRELDEGRDEAALDHLEKALRQSGRAGKALRHGLFLEAAWASAGVRGRAAQARTWYERACKLQRPDSAAAVEAAIAMCEGRYEEAERYWREARAYVDRRKLDSGLARFAKERWARFEAACRTARGDAPPGEGCRTAEGTAPSAAS